MGTREIFPQQPELHSQRHSLSSSRPPSSHTLSITTSRHSSRYPDGDFRNSAIKQINDMKCEVMVNGLRSRQEERLWTMGGEDEGVVLKKSRGQYTCAPADLATGEAGFFDAVVQLNVKVAMTVCTQAIRVLLRNNTMALIKMKEELQVQVLPNIQALPQCQKHQFAAFIADSGMLVVWDDDPNHILERIERIETALVLTIWGGESTNTQENEKSEMARTEVTSVNSDPEDPAAEKPRPIVLWQATYTAFAVALTLGTFGLGWRQIAIETALDGSYLRVLFILALVPQFWLSLFFFQCLVGGAAQILGPVNEVGKNSKSYTGKPPRRLDRAKGALPHVTIQCPVYKESLHSVIKPTILSVKAAISTYELQGGTANIFINDDGMQLISDDDAQTRREFYEEHNIGWVARPKHNPNPQGAHGEKAFVRRGKFKKASNMNYALWVSARIEDRLARISRPATWTQDDETAVYEAALSELIAADEGQTWAEGNVRLGDYILLIDSDTRVPGDCLLDAVSEMEQRQSSNVAILQFTSGVMNVTESFFEKGITFFTNLIYTQIQFAVASGDVAPFVGHNAILRWSALQAIAYDCPLDNREKYWSECTVSEDFDMALRLQTAGYLVRLGGYTGSGFKEGVSLTVYDEFARWEKYAYGCSELLFYPITQWLRPGKGLVTPLFRRFLFSRMPLPSKFTICAYIGTYYAIGASLPLAFMNYLIIGWYNGMLDHYYLPSFTMFVSVVCVFTVLGNVSLAVLRYRTSEKNIFVAFLENISWVPLLFLFLGGLSLHVSKAILCHMFGVDITWGATNKEAEDITFFEEIPRVIRTFKGTFLMCIVFTAMMISFALFMPHGWRINFFVAVFPLGIVIFAHFALPTLLNPNLIRFTW